MIQRKKYRLQTIDGMKSITLNDGTYILNEVDLGSAPIDLITYQGTNKYSRLLLDRSVNTRPVNIIGTIIASIDSSQEEMRALKRELQNIVQHLNDFYIVIDNKYKLKVAADNSVKYGTSWYENNNYLSTFSISGIAIDPYFYDYDETIVDAYYADPLFHFPLLTRNRGGSNW